MVWAYAKLGIHPASDAIQEFDKQALRICASMEPREIATLTWAAATLSIQEETDEEADPESKEGESGEDDAAPNDTRILSDALLEGLWKQSMCTIQRFNAQDLSNILWAHATLGIRVPKDLLQALQIRCVEVSKEFKPQGTRVHAFTFTL
jgi:hypothetical protein